MTHPFDTSGYVDWRGAQPFAHLNHVAWSDLSPFEQSYMQPIGVLIAQRWALAFSDLDPSALERIREDCAEWLRWYPNSSTGQAFLEIRQQALIRRDRFPPLTVFLNDAGKVCLRPTSAPDAPPLHPAQIKGESR